MRKVDSRRSSALRIPHPRSRRALLILDVEPTFLTPRTRQIIPRITRLVADGGYAIVVAAEHTKGRLKGRSLSERKGNRRSDETISQIDTVLDASHTLIVAKSTRSAFGNGNELAADLRRRRITHVHIVGLETHDCVLATTLDAFDHGFITCALEGACASKRSVDHRAALQVLRRLHLTDRSIRLR